MSASAGPFAIGVDIGGTFTDVVCLDPAGHMRLLKLPTTPRNPSAGAIEAVGFMRHQWHIPPDAIARFVHGTTIATNAVLERKGARIGLITTAGFKDCSKSAVRCGARCTTSCSNRRRRVSRSGAFRKEVPERIGPAGRGAGADRRGGGRAGRRRACGGGGRGGRGLLSVLVRQPGARAAHPRDHQPSASRADGIAVLRGRSGLSRIRAHLSSPPSTLM